MDRFAGIRSECNLEGIYATKHKKVYCTDNRRYYGNFVTAVDRYCWTVFLDHKHTSENEVILYDHFAMY